MDNEVLRLARRVKNVEEGGARIAGEVALWTGEDPPDGWLNCDGSAVSRSVYAALFAVIGTRYGSGNGSTTFRVPDMRGRMAAGYSGADAAFDILGKTGGEKTHILTAAEMPAHAHTIRYWSGNLYFTPGGTNDMFYKNGGSSALNDADSNVSGSSGAHNNLPPYIALNYIIKT